MYVLYWVVENCVKNKCFLIETCIKVLMKL